MLAEVDSLDLQTLRLDYQQARNDVDLSRKILEGLEPAEIAERVGKKPNAVYQAISRNKARLREWLEQ